MSLIWTSDIGQLLKLIGPELVPVSLGVLSWRALCPVPSIGGGDETA